MANLNPMQIMMMLKSQQPKQVAMSIIQQNYGNNPSIQNLVQMAERGDVQGLQNIAKQVLGPQRDINTELNNLMSSIKNL